MPYIIDIVNIIDIILLLKGSLVASPFHQSHSELPQLSSLPQAMNAPPQTLTGDRGEVGVPHSSGAKLAQPL